MSLWPRTLFSRNLLLMGVLILVGQLVSAWLFRELVMRPRLQLTADAAVRNFEALEAGLQSLAPAQRQQFVDHFNAHADASAPSSTGTRLTRFERTYLQLVSERLAARGSRITWQRDADHSRTLTLVLDGQRYRLNQPSPLPAREFPWTWSVGSAVTCLLAGLGAWLIQRRLNRPLNALVRAAQALGRGERPPALQVAGPSEIATVAHGFNEMVASLAHHERERTLMLAGLSHDLRTPLAKMRLATEMLSGRGDAELLVSLNRNIEAMDHLLTQFLDFTRASLNGSWDQEPLAPADLNALVREALALCTPDSPEADPHLVVQAGAIPLVMLRAQAVRRLILNLVVNARRHGAPPVEVVTQGSEGWVWLEVWDRGPGIAPERAEALKQPFVRGDGARGGPAGAGLGLSIVERIARDHGARFELLPRPGGGLVARVGWPVGPARA